MRLRIVTLLHTLARRTQDTVREGRMLCSPHPKRGAPRSPGRPPATSMPKHGRQHGAGWGGRTARTIPLDCVLIWGSEASPVGCKQRGCGPLIPNHQANLSASTSALSGRGGSPPWGLGRPLTPPVGPLDPVWSGGFRIAQLAPCRPARSAPCACGWRGRDLFLNGTHCLRACSHEAAPQGRIPGDRPPAPLPARHAPSSCPG